MTGPSEFKHPKFRTYNILISADALVVIIILTAKQWQGHLNSNAQTIAHTASSSVQMPWLPLEFRRVINFYRWLRSEGAIKIPIYSDTWVIRTLLARHWNSNDLSSFTNNYEHSWSFSKDSSTLLKFWWSWAPSECLTTSFLWCCSSTVQRIVVRIPTNCRQNLRPNVLVAKFLEEASKNVKVIS